MSAPDCIRKSRRGDHDIPRWNIHRANGTYIGFIELMPSGRWAYYSVVASSGCNDGVSAHDATAHVHSMALRWIQQSINRIGALG